ncbi:hypothetical protein U9M48_025472, partial [Paspalum notatum var. saurae]
PVIFKEAERNARDLAPVGLCRPSPEEARNVPTASPVPLVLFLSLSRARSPPLSAPQLLLQPRPVSPRHPTAHRPRRPPAAADPEPRAPEPRTAPVESERPCVCVCRGFQPRARNGPAARGTRPQLCSPTSPLFREASILLDLTLGPWPVDSELMIRYRQTADVAFSRRRICE